jgi:methylthioxylose transferase
VIQRYYQDLGRTRPYDYWVWANLAALTLAVGPVLAPALRRAALAPFQPLDATDTPRVAGRLWRQPVVVWLVLSAALAVAIADKSGLSKAEVERIWLPFGVWLVSGAALLPTTSRRWWLLAQAVTALVLGHLILTKW